ncbi:histidine triad (HIT) protein [Thermaerobacter marianensis DSM 12885]|uniref:Histidine triad (HIT) protein n=1 Tax=Thermaerobacter marianensis (strain ATCC 700841 / DSM 12885 / JCM 10246 / 7p75a) TaxID=644966 RepID=E6SKA2_THEM7|nr:histidine triad nucleotide-binding protein [Thermaerobacter marianensis]ADU52260.1 histidine triad (HIT) protein [Thermaerobacter marianensis DSM 12885]
MADCLFCRIVEGELPADKVYEDEHVVAFRDINPQAPQHVLVIPKRHIASLNEAGDEDVPVLGHLQRVIPEVARRVGVAESGYRVVVNTGRDALQTVFHVHYHVLGGRAMQWPPG